MSSGVKCGLYSGRRKIFSVCRQMKGPVAAIRRAPLRRRGGCGLSCRFHCSGRLKRCRGETVARSWKQTSWTLNFAIWFTEKHTLFNIVFHWQKERRRLGPFVVINSLDGGRPRRCGGSSPCPCRLPWRCRGCGRRRPGEAVCGASQDFHSEEFPRRAVVDAPLSPEMTRGSPFSGLPRMRMPLAAT